MTEPRRKKVRRKKTASSRSSAGAPPKSKKRRPPEQAERTKKIQAKEGSIFIQKQFNRGRVVTEDSHEQRPVAVRHYPAEVPLASVSVNGGITVNLGDYNSARIEVGVTLPCVVEELDDAYEAALAMVSQRIEEQEVELKRED